MIKKLCQSNADINQMIGNGKTALSTCCVYGINPFMNMSVHHETMKTLLDMKADLNKPINSSQLLKKTVNSKNDRKLQLLFDYGIQIKTKDEYDELLRIASKLGNSKSVEILLKNKVSKKIYNDECPICLDAIKLDSYVTSCGHAFHSKCWTKYDNKSVCPICSK